MKQKRLEIEIFKTVGLGLFINKNYIGVALIFFSIVYEHDTTVY